MAAKSGPAPFSAVAFTFAPCRINTFTTFPWPFALPSFNKSTGRERSRKRQLSQQRLGVRVRARGSQDGRDKLLRDDVRRRAGGKQVLDDLSVTVGSDDEEQGGPEVAVEEAEGWGWVGEELLRGGVGEGQVHVLLFVVRRRCCCCCCCCCCCLRAVFGNNCYWCQMSKMSNILSRGFFKLIFPIESPDSY